MKIGNLFLNILIVPDIIAQLYLNTDNWLANQMFNKYKTTIYSYLHGCSVENINVKIENKNLNLLSTRQKQCPALIFFGITYIQFSLYGRQEKRCCRS